MKNGLVISDIGPIFSLAIIDKLNILEDFRCKTLSVAEVKTSSCGTLQRAAPTVFLLGQPMASGLKN
jgi:hypothetical protein